MKVVLLAGGLGTRISEESHLRPKPMIEIGDAPILWHIMKLYSHHGFNEFIVCCGYKGYVIKEYFADYYLHRSDVTFDFSNDNSMIVHSNVAEPWKVTVVDTGLTTQTGGRIRRIRKYTDNEPFMVTYGDGVSDIDLSALLRQHQQGGHLVTISAIQPEGRFGLLDIDESSHTVTGFREKPVEESSWVNAGFMVMEQGIFDYLTDDACVLERGPIEAISRQGALGVYKHHGFWQCMDNQRDKGTLEKLWREGQAPWRVWDD